MDPSRVHFAHGGASDLHVLERELRRFAADAGAPAATKAPPRRRRSALGWAWTLGLTGALLFATGALSQLPAGSSPEEGAVRLAWRLPGQSWLDCRPLSKEEIERLPAHMRHTQDCRRVYLHYHLRAWVDGALRVDREVAPLGARGDRPLYVEQDVAVPVGRHEIRVEFAPIDDPRHAGLDLELQTPVDCAAGRARLVTYDAEARQLVLR